MRQDTHQLFLEFFSPERDKSLISTRVYMETFSEAAAALRRPASSTAHSGGHSPEKSECLSVSSVVLEFVRGREDWLIQPATSFTAQLRVQRQQLPPKRGASFKAVRPVCGDRGCLAKRFGEAKMCMANRVELQGA